MIYRTRFIATLDACVIYSAPVRDILLNLAEQELYSPKWSKQIEAEWIRNLLKNRPDLKSQSLERTVRAMNSAFPDAMVDSFEELILEIDLPDKDDRHVVAAAIESESDLIVTFNLKDFPERNLTQFDLSAIHPDSFICGLFEIDSHKVINGFENQLSSLRNPPMTRDKLKNTLRKCGLPKASELF